MSGGVDSSVAACLLKDQGYDCVGVFMCVGGPAATRAADEPTPEERRLRHGCCAPTDQADARTIAGKLGIPFHVLNLRADFDRIIEYFADEYARARTPNPCILCNTLVKFGTLLEHADRIDADFVATGHYARILRGATRPAERPGKRAGEHVFLARSLNKAKDQSYVLFGIKRENLTRCLFPLGEIDDKATVRRIAADLGLRVHDKPDSQEICFVPDNDYRRVVRERRPDTVRPGEVHDTHGNLLGTHDGVAGFTIGQRRGLGIARGEPVYVTALDARENTVTLGPREDLLATGLIADQANWLVDPPPVDQWQPAEIKIRYQHKPSPGSFRRLDSDGIEVRFDHPQPAVTPGQAAVLYSADGVIMVGGWIRQAVGRRQNASACPE